MTDPKPAAAKPTADEPAPDQPAARAADAVAAALEGDDLFEEFALPDGERR